MVSAIQLQKLLLRSASTLTSVKATPCCLPLIIKCPNSTACHAWDRFRKPCQPDHAVDTPLAAQQQFFIGAALGTLRFEEKTPQLKTSDSVVVFNFLLLTHCLATRRQPAWPHEHAVCLELSLSSLNCTITSKDTDAQVTADTSFGPSAMHHYKLRLARMLK